MNAASKPGTDRPVKPINRPLAVSSNAHSPESRSAKPASIRSTIASPSSLAGVAGKCSVTSGPALIAESGARPGACQRRITNRRVRICSTITFALLVAGTVQTVRVGVPVPSNLAARAEANEQAGWLAALHRKLETVRDRWSLQVGDPFKPGGNTAWVAPATSLASPGEWTVSSRAHICWHT